MHLDQTKCWLVLGLIAGIIGHGSSARAAAPGNLSFNINFDATADQEPVDIARAYLKQEASALGIETDLSNLAEPEAQESLIAHHFRFQQTEQGVPVKRAAITVSIDKETHKILKVYSTLAPKSADRVDMSSVTLIQKPMSADLAWNHLRVYGELNDFVRSDLVMVERGGQLIPAYQEQIDTTGPNGSWEITVDARTGEILSTEDTRVFESSARNKMRTRLNEVRTHAGPVIKRWKAEARLLLKRLREKTRLQRLEGDEGSETETEARADGTGYVFNPDPMTFLQTDKLKDEGDDSDAFEKAYVEKPLKDITFTSGVYYLKGPWVQIKDLDSPYVKPSTTTTGAWKAKRGDDAFDDVMVYFHIDQNQRYMQDLGFKDKTGIQFGSIEADSNGADGADNSFFIPRANQLVFGHGCVNDSEDADVILHEYGHAIQHSINKTWEGGDTRAMGEGFGDYWAAAYNLREEISPDYEVGKVFNWDASNDCWPGRRLDKLKATYDPTRTYYDHEPLSGFISDELWSTPLYQALLDLRKLGIAQKEVDQIILESHFGLGANVKMPDMARAILATAGKLYPEGPHRKVFLEKFAVHKILKSDDKDLP